MAIVISHTNSVICDLVLRATLEFHLQHPGIFSSARNLHLFLDLFIFLY